MWKNSYSTTYISNRFIQLPPSVLQVFGKKRGGLHKFVRVHIFVFIHFLVNPVFSFSVLDSFFHMTNPCHLLHSYLPQIQINTQLRFWWMSITVPCSIVSAPKPAQNPMNLQCLNRPEVFLSYCWSFSSSRTK